MDKPKRIPTSKKLASFRLSARTRARLAEIAADRQLTQTAVLESLVRCTSTQKEKEASKARRLQHLRRFT